MQVVNFKGQKRASTGSSNARSLRREGRIPCVLYGGDTKEYFSIEPADVKSLIYTPDFKIAEIELDGNQFKSIVKDIQFHPVTDKIEHIDFLRLIDGNTIKVELPVKFKGISPGVKAGGKLVQTMRRVKVKTTPENMTDRLFVSIDGLQLGQSVRVKDLEVPEGIEIMSNSATPVGQIAIPRALKSATAAAEE